MQGDRRNTGQPFFHREQPPEDDIILLTGAVQAVLKIAFLRRAVIEQEWEGGVHIFPTEPSVTLHTTMLLMFTANSTTAYKMSVLQIPFYFINAHRTEASCVLSKESTPYQFLV
jgi:hypothetical protein